MNDHRSDQSSLPQRIVSGGQTGVDRAALDVAIASGIAHGGWCPAGRLAEDGCIPERYQLTETGSPDYPVRTERNVIDSDATLILYEGVLKGGTKLTRRFCRRYSKPHLCLSIDENVDVAITDAVTWLREIRPRVLNVAGPRESTCPGIFERSKDFLTRTIESVR